MQFAKNPEHTTKTCARQNIEFVLIPVIRRRDARSVPRASKIEFGIGHQHKKRSWEARRERKRKLCGAIHHFILHINDGHGVKNAQPALVPDWSR